jgi:hypothetical protein
VSLNDAPAHVVKHVAFEIMYKDYREWRRQQKEEHNLLFEMVREKVDIRNMITLIKILISVVVMFAASQVGIYYKLAVIEQEVAVMKALYSHHQSQNHIETNKSIQPEGR